MTFHERVLGMLQRILERDRGTPEQKLYESLRLLAKYRSELIASHVIGRDGLTVRSGPFAGMTMTRERSEGCLVPKLLGCYEGELHEILRSLPERGYESVVNIGCAEGYYAVGLARLLPDAKILAYDIDPKARDACAALATANAVDERIEIGERFATEDFAAITALPALVVCDIEGGEVELLDPDAAPALRKLDLLVELHDCFDPTISERIVARFEDSHDVTVIKDGARDIGSFPELASLEHLDQLLAFWEWRTGPTPWAFMTVKRR